MGESMTFNSYQFLIFFPIVLLVYFIVPRKVRYIWLLLSSYYFYMSWGVSYGIWLGVSTVVTYLSGILLDRENEKQREIYGCRSAEALLMEKPDIKSMFWN